MVSFDDAEESERKGHGGIVRHPLSCTDDSIRLRPSDDEWGFLLRRMHPPKPAPSCPFEKPEVEGGRYTIERILGHGGVSYVYKARDRETSRSVAVKVMNPVRRRDNILSRRPFARECLALALLQHPNIIKGFGPVQMKDGKPALLLEYLEGIDLFDYLVAHPLEATPFEAFEIKGEIQKNKWWPRWHEYSIGVLKRYEVHCLPYRCVSELFIASVIIQLALALHAGHQKGILHRDVKPENVMLQLGTLSTLGDVRAVLFDYGSALFLSEVPFEEFAFEERLGPKGRYDTSRFVEDARINTQPDGVVGTPDYLAPEQVVVYDSHPFVCRPARNTPASDLYSLGILMYQLLASRRPFYADDKRDILVKHVLCAVPPFMTLTPYTPLPELEAICMKLLDKDPAARYQTGQEVADAVKTAIAPYVPVLKSATHVKNITEIGC